MAVDKSDQNGPYQVLMTFVERSPLWTASLVSPLKSVAEAVNVASSLSLSPSSLHTSLWLGCNFSANSKPSATFYKKYSHDCLHTSRVT